MLPNSTSLPAECDGGIVTPRAGSNSPTPISAGPLPDLSLPHTVLSTIDNMVGKSGVIQNTADNLTLYNFGVSMRLLGELSPHDELLGTRGRILSSFVSWDVESNSSGVWAPLIPSSNNFSVIGTNSSGTFVARSMVVSTGLYSGTLKIVYKALATGVLKWDLEFGSKSDGNYRLRFSWWKLPSNIKLLSTSSEFRANFTRENYVLNWNDVPKTFPTETTISGGMFSLSINLGHISAGTRVKVDPTISGTTSNRGTAYTFQRHVFFDPNSAYYWAFYYDGGGIVYRYSRNGTNWSQPYTPPGGIWYNSYPGSYDDYFFPTILFSGHTVFLARGQEVADTNNPSLYTYSVSLYIINGTVSGNNISWNCSPQCVYTPVKFTSPCPNANPSDPNGYCYIRLGIRYVNLGLSSSGSLALSYNFYQQMTPPSSLQCPYYSESDAYLLYGKNNVAMRQVYTAVHPYPIPPYSYTDCTDYYNTDHDRSVIVPLDGQNKIRVMYQSGGSTPFLRSFESDGTNLLDNIGPFGGTDGPTSDSDAFSCVSDSNYGTHCIFQQPNGKAGYRHQPTNYNWYGSNDLFSGNVSYPTLTIDQSTNEIYAFGISGGSILMKVKLSSHTWPDSATVYLVANRNSPVYLGSNLASASMTNSSTIALVWTEGSYPYNVNFASIPVGTAWSPYSNPADPWDGNGLAPYGQYFQNLGEYVSVSTGLLTLKQTDLTVPGRGLNLDLTRVYTEPYLFLNGQTYNYETYPWAPLGYGWQLNFPWMNNTSQPSYIHLWDGEGYRIPSSFWLGPIANFQNDQGEHFRLVKNTDNSIVLYAKTGVSYLFDPTHKLTTIVDQTGTNTISFSYSNNMISCITDSIQRAFVFTYGSGFLQTISQVTGSCASPGTTIRSIQYGNNGQSLTTMTDPANRVTTYAYSTGLGGAPWIISRITYPTNWYTNYTFTRASIGTTATSYRVIKQFVGFGSSPTRVREFDYGYANGAVSQVNNSTVTAIDGTTTVSYTTYSFSFKGVNFNVSDPSHHFLRGIEQIFGISGEIPQEIVLVSPSQGYSNYYDYDSWGNLIYSRQTVNQSSQFKETFNAYYNNGLPPVFNAFQDTFSQNGGTLPDNSWSVSGGAWFVTSGVGFMDNNFTLGWVNMCQASCTFTTDGDIGTMTNAGSGAAIWKKAVPGNLSTNTFTRLVVRGRTVVGSGGIYMSVMYNDSSVSSQTTSFYSSFTVFTFPLVPNRTIAWVRVGLASSTNGDSIQLDYVAITNKAPSSQFDNLGQYSGAETNGPQENVFSWASINKTDVSVQAKVLVRNLANTTSYSSGQRFGIFVHYPGYNSYKWALAIVTYPNSATSLALIDEWRGTIAAASCIPVQFGAWYTFNMTAHGFQAAGWASLPGAAPCSVSGTFQPSSPAATGTGFGLYAGGYSTLFSDVTATPVSPSITSTGFSNSFFQNSTPSPNIHDALAGTAQLQNGPGSLSKETYYGYTNWGGVSQTNRLYGSDPQQPQISITAWPTTDTYTRSWGLTTDQPLPTTWWPTYEVTRQTSNYTYPTTRPFSPGVHYIEFGISGSVPNFAWHAKIFVNGNLRAEGDVGRYNHLRAYFVVGVQWFTNSMTYDMFGNLKTLTDPMGNFTYYAYGGPNYAYPTNVTRVIGPTSLTTLFTYDANYGTVLSSTDPKGNVTSYQYDVLTRRTRVNYPLQGYVSYSYNDVGNYVEITNENGLDTRQVYDGLGRLSTVERFSGGVFYSNATTVYNWMNKVNRQTDPLGNSYQNQYDALGRITRIIKPDGNSTQLSYNDVNSQVISSDEYGNQRCTIRDFLGRTVSVIEYSDATCHPRTIGGYTYVTNYSYDSVGNLKSVLTANGQNTTYTYDNLNRAVEMSYPDGTFQSSTYDSIGNVVGTTDRNNVATLYSYDSIGRLQTATHCGATVISESYTYDKAGNIISSQNQNATISYAYDARNRILSETYTANPSTRSVVNLGCLGNPGTWTVTGGQTNTDTISYTYNGELTNTIVYPGVMAQYNYDGLGRPVSVLHAGTGVYLATVSYYPNDQVRGIQYGNGLIGNYTYDRVGRYSTIKLANGGTTMMLLAYNYNKTGTVASVIGQVNQGTVNEQYRYDPLQRLTNATVVSGGATTNVGYQYDNVGNRLSQTLNGVVTSYTYNAPNNELAYYSTSSPFFYNRVYYDANGNVRSKVVTTNTTVTWTYSWDAANRLIGVTNSTGQAQYAYDSSGRNIEAVESGATSFLIYQGTEVLHKRLLNNDKYAYVYIAGFRVSMIISGSSRYYFHTDSIGSTRMMTWQNGGMVYVNNYQPFGLDNGSSQGSFANRAFDKFTGQRISVATGLFYYFQRWYDPAIGRFVSTDSFPGILSHPDSLNYYTYAGNTPTTNTDPTGRSFYHVGSSLMQPCPSVWSDPLGSFTCQLSRTPTPIADVVQGYTLAVDLSDMCEQDCPQLLEDAGGLLRGASSEIRGGVTVSTDALRTAGTDVSTTSVRASGEIASPAASQIVRDSTWVPNPGGRLGGLLHRTVVKDLIEFIRSRGLTFETEYHFPEVGRFADVVALDAPGGNVLEIYQVGKMTSRTLLPVAREIYAAGDILDALGVPVVFVPYNV